MGKIMKNGIEYGGGWETYEEGEYEIGTFLGKPLYRKVIKTNTTLPASQSTPNYATIQVGSISGYLTNLMCVCSNSQGTVMFVSPSKGYCYYENPNIYVRQEVADNTNYSVKAIIMEYTKEAW